MRIIYISIIIFFMCVSNLYAGIDSISGNFISGGTLTITGSSFGSGDTSFILWDDFESGTDGELLNLSPSVGSWGIPDYEDEKSKYSNDYFHSGKQSSVSSLSTGGSLRGQFYTPQTGVMSDTYYYIYFWFQYDNTDSESITKICQLAGTYKIGDYNPGFFSTIMSGGIISYTALENSGAVNQNNVTAPSANAWHCFELILKQSTIDTEDGQIVMIIDGSTIYNQVNVVTREIEGESWERHSYFYGYYNVPEGHTMSTIVDDVYMNNSWARVMIGDNPVLTNCTHREIQIPTAWSDTEITITFNKGSFANGTPVFLFVIDSDGNASAGYPITIGAQSGNGTTSTGIRIKSQFNVNGLITVN